MSYLVENNFRRSVQALQAFHLVSPGSQGAIAGKFLDAMQGRGIFDLTKLDCLKGRYKDCAQNVIDGVNSGFKVSEYLSPSLGGSNV